MFTLLSPNGSRVLRNHRRRGFSGQVMERGAENVAHAPMPQRNDGETMKASSDQTKMNPKLWSRLGEDLLEKIVVRLPLKDIVQCQVLSKWWRSRFQSSSFQTEVSRHSSGWGSSKSYRPLRLTEKGLCGYDRSTQKWKDLCTVPEFPSDFYKPHRNVEGKRWRLWGRKCSVKGNFLLTWRLVKDGTMHVFITNLINKTIRRCVPTSAPIMEGWALGSIIMSTSIHLCGNDHYKVVILYIQFIQVYDSKSDSWTNCVCVVPIDWKRLGASVYLRGVIYTPYMAPGEGSTTDVVLSTFDVEKGLFGKIIPSRPVSPDGVWHLVAWRSQLVHVAVCEEGLSFFTVNLETLQLTEILRGLSDTSSHQWKDWDSTQTFTFVSDHDSDNIHLILRPVDPEGSKIDYRILTFLITCDVNKPLWSYSCVDSSESRYNRVGRIELSAESSFQPNFSQLSADSSFQPNFSPFVLA